MGGLAGIVLAVVLAEELLFMGTAIRHEEVG